MNKIGTTPDGWQPQTQQDREAVLRELQRVLSSSHFCNSKRYPALLRYVVESTLAGRSELLKERTLGVEVFDRSPTFDTNSDTVVRYTASEVRKRLFLYYHEEGKDSSIRIILPTGSYVPEFQQGTDRLDETGLGSDSEPTRSGDAGGIAEWEKAGPDSGMGLHPDGPEADLIAKVPPAVRIIIPPWIRWATLAVIVTLISLAALVWRNRISHPQTAVDEFWAPILQGKQMVVICTGSVVFAQDRYSGVITTGTNGDIKYPFVSIQSASAIAEIESSMETSGVKTQLITAPWTTLTDLREHPITLLGAYNNQWTLRFTDPLRFHFAPDPQAKILDRMQPQISWERDQNVPYSSADDYALVARFRDTTVDGWIVALAGLGRNGTEAAAQFVTDPHYMELLRDKIGTGFENKNIEVLLKVHVIDAKTGAPSILAVHSW
jgi:hypothetical protein